MVDETVSSQVGPGQTIVELESLSKLEFWVGCKFGGAEWAGKPAQASAPQKKPQGVAYAGLARKLAA